VKVLYIATAFPRFEGDIITPWLVEVVRRLKAKSVNVELYTSSYKGLASQELFGIKIHRFRYFFKKWEALTHDETAVDRVKKGVLNKLLVPFYMLMGTMQIVRLARKNKYDIIHTHWPLPHAVFGYTASKISGAKHILYFHGVELMWVKTELKLLKPFLRWAIRKADAVMCNSSHTAARIKEIYDREVHIIPSGQAAMSDMASAEKKHHTIKEKQILFVGRLVERKGVKFLIEAFANMVNQIDSRLNIVGTGPDMDMLKALALEKGVADKVIFLGKVTAQELDWYYQNGDVFVLPAVIDSKGDTEGLGVVLIEALTYKIPVIATNCGGIVDIIKDNQTGVLVPEKNSQALADALTKILSDPNYAQTLAQNGYDYVNTKYNWNTITDQIISLFSQFS
jgi:glycosyltransferase involved in cell wall biosynthesis